MPESDEMLIECHFCGSNKRDETLLCMVPSDDGPKTLWGHVECFRENLYRLRPDIRVMAGPGDYRDGLNMADLEGQGWGQPTVQTWFELENELRA